jgi:3',5'-nucleoside bisphosphate phosphatase
LIDLHMHTTASDGRLTPAELVARVHSAGLTTISVTDHDTVAALAEVTALASPLGIRVIPGIEITAVDRGRDLHMLGYFFDPDSEPLLALLVSQRALRVARVREIAGVLAALDRPIDIDSVLLSAAARPGSSVGRPQIARALVAAGHAASVQDAFDRWLAAGRPAFVPRTGPGAGEVIDAIHAAGGLASFAHPGVTARDDLIAPLVARGLDAVEAHHADHTPEQVSAYRAMARTLGALITGGSDFHGEDTQTPAPSSARATGGARVRRATLGVVTLPPADFTALAAAAARAARRPPASA